MVLWKQRGDYMIRIAIIDDAVEIGTQLETILIEITTNKGIAIDIDIYYSGKELCEHLQNGEFYDLIFLDIEFQLSNGVEIVQRIRMELECEKVQIVYISAKQSYAMELFPIRPMNFLVKPISRIDVINNVDKAIELSEIYGSFFE